MTFCPAMEDERQVELDCIAAIYPEIQFDPENKFSASIELPVHPTNPVKVVFPASSDGLLVTPPPSSNSGQEYEQAPANNAESHNLAYLPPLQLRITLPDGYPEEQPAKFEISTTPAWLGRSYLDKLQENGESMWEESGHSSVVYGYIDFLQQEAENAFGFAERGKTLEIPQDFKISLLDYDIKATQAAFEKETFDCGVCLGSAPSRGNRTLLISHRSQEGFNLPPDDRLRPRFLRSMSAGLLQQCDQRGGSSFGPLSGTRLHEEACRDTSIYEEDSKTKDAAQPQRTAPNPPRTRCCLSIREVKAQGGARVG